MRASWTRHDATSDEECVALFAVLQLTRNLAVPAQKRREPFLREICVFKAKPASKMVRVLQ